MSTPEQRAKKAAWNRAHRARKGVPAKQSRTEPTASVIETTSATGRTRYISQVRELDGRRTYLGSHPTHAQAMAACAEYIATGRRPPPKQRGMKPGQRKRPGSLTRWGTPVLLTDQQACPLPTAERLARNAAKHATMPVLPVSAPPATSDTPEARHEAPAPPKPRATWREIAARFA